MSDETIQAPAAPDLAAMATSLRRLRRAEAQAEANYQAAHKARYEAMESRCQVEEKLYRQLQGLPSDSLYFDGTYAYIATNGAVHIRRLTSDPEGE